MKTVIIIPARYDSSRFKGKPLAKINGQELVLWTYEVAKKTVGLKNVFIATDSKKIFNFLLKRKIQGVMTSKKCLTGTDRVAEAAQKIKADIYINLQGDEPLVDSSDIKKIIKKKIAFFNHVICGYNIISKNEKPKNFNIPKVTITKFEDLIYISRSLIPGSKSNKKKIKYLKQVCIYAFNKKELSLFFNFGKKSYIEKLEDIELLRFFDLKIPIKMVKTTSTSLAVDCLGDIDKIEKFLKKL